MSFCSNCGNPLKAGAKFCSKCGTQMSAPGAGTCPLCHKPVSGNEKFCAHCGASIANVVSSQTPPTPAVQTTPAQHLAGAVDTSRHAQAAPQNVAKARKKKKGGCFWKTLLIVLILGISGLTALYFLGDEPVGPGSEGNTLTNTDIPGIVSIDDSIAEVAPPEALTDTGDPKQAAATVEEAFERADTSLLKQMLTPRSQEIYKDAFKEIKPYMSEYSKAFKNRKLRISTPIYSLYEFSDAEGKTYTAEFALSDDGQWKLVRF